MKKICAVLLYLSCVARVMGQDLPTSKGTLQDAEFIVKKERKHALPRAQRLFRSVATFSPIKDSVVALDYVLPDLFPVPDTLNFATKVLRAKQDAYPQYYGSYFKMGYGNVRTPYIEGYFTHPRRTNYTYDCQIKHWSMGHRLQTEARHSLLQLHGKRFLDAICLSGILHYYQARYPLHAPANQFGGTITRYQIVGQGTLQNFTHRAFTYQLDGLFYRCLSTDNEPHTDQYVLRGHGDYTVNDVWMLKVLSEFSLEEVGGRQGSECHRWCFKPILCFKSRHFHVQGGVNLVYHNAMASVSNYPHGYPVMEVKYMRHRAFTPYLGIWGDVLENSLRHFMTVQPLLAPCAVLHPTNQRFEFYGGARGDAMAALSWHTRLAVGIYQKWHCIVNNVQDPSRFDIQYDTRTRLVHLLGELTYTSQSDALYMKLSGDLWHYTLSSLKKPWHHPHYQIKLYNTYRLYDKVTFRNSVCWLGGVEAWDTVRNQVLGLKDVVDVSLGVDYWLGPQVLLFLDCQNLLGKCNERYLHYPMRGIHCVAGLTYSW